MHEHSGRVLRSDSKWGCGEEREACITRKGRKPFRNLDLDAFICLLILFQNFCHVYIVLL